MTVFFNRLPIVCLLLIATFARANEPTPRLISPGVVSTAQGEYSPTFDTTRRELVFMRRTPGQFDYTLYSTRVSEDGWSEPEALKMNIRQLVPKNKIKELATLTKRLKNNEPVNSLVTQRLCKNGKILAVWLTVTGLKDKSDRLVEFATTERDITEFKNIGSPSTRS